MADLNIEKIAKALGNSLDDPTITKKVDNGPKKEINPQDLVDKENSKDSEEASVSDGEKPSFAPDLSGSVDYTPPKETSKNSQIDTATSISAITILKQELGKVGCQLSDYQVKFNLNGIDINNVKVTTPNIDELRAIIPEIEGDDKHKIASKISSLAMRAIQDNLNERIQSELGLSTSAFEYDNVDQAALSMAVAPEEESGPEEIAGMMEPELGDMGMEEPPMEQPAPEMEPMAEPGMEEPAAAPAEPGMEPMAPESMPGAAPEAMPAGPAPAMPPM